MLILRNIENIMQYNYELRFDISLQNIEHWVQNTMAAKYLTPSDFQQMRKMV